MTLQQLKESIIDSLNWDTFVCIHIPMEIITNSSDDYEELQIFLHELPNLKSLAYKPFGKVEIELTKPLKSIHEELTKIMPIMTPEQFYSNIIANFAYESYQELEFPDHFTVSECFLVEHWLHDELKDNRKFWLDTVIFADDWKTLNISVELIPK